MHSTTWGLKLHTTSSTFKGEGFDSRLGEDTTWCLMWGEKGKKKKKKKSPRQSERVQNFQINFKPLSPASAKPQQLSCCDLILFFCPVTPFFPRLNTSFLLKKTVPKLAGAKNNRRRSPKEANIPRTCTSSVRSCAESALRTLGLEKHGQLINGEVQQTSPSLLKHVAHCFFRKTRIVNSF